MHTFFFSKTLKANLKFKRVQQKVFKDKWKPEAQKFF